MIAEQKPRTSRPRGRPRREDEGEVTARILDAATDLFLKNGVAATSCEAVVARARVGKASLYSRYSGKDALFEAVVQQAVDRGAISVAAPAPPTATLRDRLAIAGRAVLLQAVSPLPLALMRLFLTEARRFPALIAEVDGMARSRVVDIVAGAVMAGRKETDASERAVTIAERFLDLTFAPIMLSALTGHDAAKSVSTIDSTIASALDMMDRSGLLQDFR